MDLKWDETKRLVSVEEYEKQYGPKELENNPESGKVESAVRDTKHVDYFSYESRPIPFGIAGLQSVTKLCQFSATGGDLDTSKLTTIIIVVNATTMEDQIYRSRETAFDVSMWITCYQGTGR